MLSAVFFFRGESCRFVCLAGHCEMHLFPTCGCCWESLRLPLFLAISMSQFCQSEGDESERGLRKVPQNAGEAGYHPALPFLQTRTLFGWEFPLGTEQCQLPGQDGTGRTKLPASLPVCLSSGTFVPLCCYSFVSGRQSSRFVHG